VSGAGTSAAAAGRWALAIALAGLIVGVPLLAWLARGIWWLLAGRRGGGTEPALYWGRSLVVGEDNRVSTSKTAAVVWTYSLAAALLSFVIARWLGHSRAFHVLQHQGLNAQYAVLIGGPLGAAILAKGIVSSQVASGAAAKPPAANPAAAQLVQNDAGNADLGDVQYLLFNVVALVFFYGQLLRMPQAGMPTIPDVLLGLTSVSAVGFVGKKALTGPGGISSVQPKEGSVGDTVTIATAGIIQDASDLAGVTIKFGDVAASPGSLRPTTTTSFGVLIDATVPDGATGKVAITVSFPTGKPASWPAFAVKPVIVRQHLVGRRGEIVRVQTTGVVGADHGPLTGVSATIAGKTAPVALAADGTFEVTVPATAPDGDTTLEVVTAGGRVARPFTVAP
jgi:hypothetical protein